MPMPLNQSPSGATQAALTQAQAPQAQNPQAPQQPNNPQNPQQPQQPEQSGGGLNSDPEIAKNLEAHLNQLPDKLKMFLAGALQHYPNIVIPVLGIVCGQEVFDYFVNMYKQNFQKPGQQGPQVPQVSQQKPGLPQMAPHPATGQQPNSAPPAPNMGQAQQQPIQQSPQ